MHDVLTTLKRRAPFIAVEVYPSLVQGEGAEKGLLEALQRAEKDRNSVILLVRGGGSLEDLQAFNSETLARAVFACNTPIVSGVGHETDVSIVDFVADVRAPTPTAAAEMVSPDKAELLTDLSAKYKQLSNKVLAVYRQKRMAVGNATKRLQRQSPQRQVLEKKQQLDDYERSLFGKINNLERLRQQYVAQQNRRLQSLSPQAKLTGAQRQLAEQNLLLIKKIKQRLDITSEQLTQKSERLPRLALSNLNQTQAALALKKEKLMLLDPLSVLGRGYAVVFTDEAQLVRSANSLMVGEEIRIRLADGQIIAKVVKTEK